MTADIMIRAERLGKKYLIGHHRERERYVALRDVLARSAQRAWRRTVDLAHGRALLAGDQVEEFWALRDIEFDVRRGEVLGIIGRNGAGKSTLLKILSRITEPSAGRVTIKGRVASLLEVGTGFHPELTGRENIFLNGAILGMTRTEMRRKFDEIVAFAEVEKFLDTPVKRYSSGMYVRLAFAVAAHLEPEIMVVDEVLAVGDAEFQRKCLGKMRDVSSHGRTVVFVSHNMGAIRALTRRCLLLDGGRIQADTSAAEAVEAYLAHAARGVEGGVFLRGEPPARGRPFHVHQVTTRREPDAEPINQFDCDQPFLICVDYAATRRVPGLFGYINLLRADGAMIYEGDSRDMGCNPLDEINGGEGRLLIKVPPRILGAGTYQIYLSFRSGFDSAGPEIDTPGIVGQFVVDDTRTLRGNHRNGYLSTIFDWEHASS
jgi:ABC-type polysaccharide/polyol phosphate transport system ATPase subunit